MLMNVFSTTPWWAITLIWIGIFAVITLISSLFWDIGDDSPKRFATSAFPVDSENFLLAAAGLSNSPLLFGEEVKILKNGVQFLPALLRALENAKLSITFTVYVWEDGKMADQVLNLLIKKAKTGIEVRLLLDAVGSIQSSSSSIDKLKDAGGKVETFRPFQVGKFTRLHRRTHRRAIVVDGKVGFTGGMAIADKWLGNAEDKKHWRDTMFEVHGNMARGLQSAFAELWAGTNGEILSGPKFYPEDYIAKLNEQKENKNIFLNVVSSPASDTEPLSKLIWLSIAAAQKKIYITSSYMVPDKYISSVLRAKARAGVDVRLLVPDDSTDAKPIRQASHYYYEKFLEAGVRIFEYKQTMMHSKILLIDDKWAIIGSANMDLRSMALNEENVLGILDESLGEKLDVIFQEDINKAEEIKLDKWKKRSLYSRLLEIIFVRFTKQY